MDVSIADARYHRLRSDAPHSRFEDGTLPFLTLAALCYGFEWMELSMGGADRVGRHARCITRYIAQQVDWSAARLNSINLFRFYSDRNSESFAMYVSVVHLLFKN